MRFVLRGARPKRPPPPVRTAPGRRPKSLTHRSELPSVLHHASCRTGLTRNHQCRTIEELLNEVYDWFRASQSFPIETTLYRLAA